MSTDEKDKLQEISQVSLYSAGVMPASIRYCFRILQRHLQGENLLEMGLAEGVMTELLATTGKSMTVVEGSALFCETCASVFHRLRLSMLCSKV